MGKTIGILYTIIATIVIYILVRSLMATAGELSVAMTINSQLSMTYEEHLSKEYIKTICGVEAPTLTSDNRAGTARDLACMVGAREKAKAEVAELMLIKK